MAVKSKRFFPRLWLRIKRVFIILFLLHFVYILLLKWVNPPVTITQLASLFNGYGLKRDYVTLDEISSSGRLAFIAAEDQLFPDHNGFDFKSIRKAVAYNKRKPGRMRGGSTISQQVAKNVFLWQGRSWFRKVLETYFTFMIELIWGKKRILEMYLNVVEMGKGIFGVEAAAKSYYNKSAAKLLRREAAMIASCLPNPKKYTVKPISRYVALNYPRILRHMLNLQKDPDMQTFLQ